MQNPSLCWTYTGTCTRFWLLRSTGTLYPTYLPPSLPFSHCSPRPWSNRISSTHPPFPPSSYWPPLTPESSSLNSWYQTNSPYSPQQSSSPPPSISYTFLWGFSILLRVTIFRPLSSASFWLSAFICSRGLFVSCNGLWFILGTGSFGGVTTTGRIRFVKIDRRLCACIIIRGLLFAGTRGGLMEGRKVRRRGVAAMGSLGLWVIEINGIYWGLF